MVKNTE